MPEGDTRVSGHLPHPSHPFMSGTGVFDFLPYLVRAVNGDGVSPVYEGTLVVFRSPVLSFAPGPASNAEM